MRAGTALRAGLDPPMLTPADVQDAEEETPPNNIQVGPDGLRTSQAPQAPGSWQEQRIMIAMRAAQEGNFTPGAQYANDDRQRGGAPGTSEQTGGTDEGVITSQGPDGVTTVNGVPKSARKLSYGWSDFSSHYPTFVGAHLKIQWNANPNKPQLNPTPFNTEGPSMNTQYSTPAPFAAGTFIG